ncbi:BEL1-like homeodomain protein 9 [Wolffia australiana]
MSQSFPAGSGHHQTMADGGVGATTGVCLPFYHVSQPCRRDNSNVPSPSPPFLHYLPSGANPSAFSFPYSSSYNMLNSGSSPSLSYEYGAGPGFNLLEQNYYDSSPVQNQASHGISLSLSSSVVSSSQHPHQDHLLGPARMELVPAGPFTGYATILRGSRFLQPAQQMLEEVCGSGRAEGLVGDSTAELGQLDFGPDCLSDIDRNMDEAMSGDQRRIKARLISLLEEVCRRHRVYFQQIQTVVTSFESVAGLNTAAPYTSFAVKSLLKHFRSLKDAISSQLRLASEPGREGSSREDILGQSRFIPGAFGSGPVNQQPAWRPQRGLPERAVAVLRAWLFEHFLHPYPSDMDKQMLAKQTGLSRNQVSNWFINARVRLWKPMVEEIHSLEQRRRVSGADDDEGDDDKQLDPSISSPGNDHSQQPSSSSPKSHEHRRFQSELVGIAEPENFSLDPMTGVVNGSGHDGVSLTLGLHQNNGYCLPEQLPLNVARRFGLDDGNVSYVMGGYEGQERQFAKEYDGQLLRDFVA